MDWLDQMNQAMDYIESNLAHDISYDRAAQIVCCSVYHFQRMFSFITGVPLSEYIRRRRLTLAAFELQTNDHKVIDIAAKYRYESPEAFSRAFKKLHGITPISARDKGVTLTAYPKMTFSIFIRGDTQMKYRVEEKKSFAFFGLIMETTVLDGQCYKDIPAFWDACRKDGRYAALMQAAGKPPDGRADAGVTFNWGADSDGNMSYMIACRKLATGCPPDYYELITLCQTWIVFSCDLNGQKDHYRETWRRIYCEWFPTADYEHAKLDMDMEMYSGSEQTGYGVEIWVPVMKKGPIPS